MGFGIRWDLELLGIFSQILSCSGHSESLQESTQWATSDSGVNTSDFRGNMLMLRKTQTPPGSLQSAATAALLQHRRKRAAKHPPRVSNFPMSNPTQRVILLTAGSASLRKPGTLPMPMARTGPLVSFQFHAQTSSL